MQNQVQTDEVRGFEPVQNLDDGGDVKRMKCKQYSYAQCFLQHSDRPVQAIFPMDLTLNEEAELILLNASGRGLSVA